MATGPEHYREAESLLEQAERKRHKQRGQERYYLEAAQVHATLALAAATALASNIPDPDGGQWRYAVGAETNAKRAVAGV